MGETVSDAQWQALQALPAGRPVMLQYHWQWAGQAPVDLHRILEQAGTRLLSRSAVDLLAIGQSRQQWSEVWLLEYVNPAAAQAHALSAGMQQLLAVAAEAEVLVATPPPPRMRRFIAALSRVLPWLPAPRRGKGMPESELQGGINPTPTQMHAFNAAAQTTPIHMFNLLRFHERARYADGDRGRSGRRAYEDGYGRVAMSCFLRLDGRIVALGRYRLTLVGAGGDPASAAWDEIAVIEYPHRRAFAHMLCNPGYIRALEHRHAGLAHTEVWSTAPLTVGPQT